MSRYADGKSRFAARRRARRVDDHGDDRYLPVACQVCARRKLTLFPGPAGELLGLYRCRGCGLQGAAMMTRPDGSLTVVTPEGEIAAHNDGKGGVVMLTSVGPVSVWPDQGQICVEHDNGRMLIDNDGRLLEARGIFNEAYVTADLPPPCPNCGSSGTAWRHFETAHEPLQTLAGALGKELMANHCDGRVQLIIQDVGGQVAACSECGAVKIYPTLATGDAVLGL